MRSHRVGDGSGPRTADLACSLRRTGGVRHDFAQRGTEESRGLKRTVQTVSMETKRADGLATSQVTTFGAGC